MKIFITGPTGFIGSHLTEILVNKGYQVKCLVRKSANLQWIKNLPIEFVYGDLFSHEILKDALKEVDYIYHVAGVVASKNKEGYYLGNQVATRNLLLAAKNNSNLKRFVYISSQTAVGPSLNGRPVNEETSYHPITTYGKSKMQAEEEVLNFKNVLPYTIIRLPAIYGPRDTGAFDFFKIVSLGIIPLVGFNKKYISLLHSKDTVEGILLAGEHQKAVDSIYFLGSEKPYSWDEIGEVTQKVLHRKSIKVRIPEFLVMGIAGAVGLTRFLNKKPSVLNWEKGKDMIANAWTCDISKAKNELGFQQNVSLEEGIEQTISWYKENGWIK